MPSNIILFGKDIEDVLELEFNHDTVNVDFLKNLKEYNEDYNSNPQIIAALFIEAGIERSNHRGESFSVLPRLPYSGWQEYCHKIFLGDVWTVETWRSGEKIKEEFI